MVRTPIVVPWSDSTLVAPPLLRNTVASALAAADDARRPATRASAASSCISRSRSPPPSSDRSPTAASPRCSSRPRGRGCPPPTSRPARARSPGSGAPSCRPSARSRRAPTVPGAVLLPALVRQADPGLGGPPARAGADRPGPAGDDRRARPGAPARAPGRALGRCGCSRRASRSRSPCSSCVALRLTGAIDIAPPGPVGGTRSRSTRPRGGDPDRPRPPDRARDRSCAGALGRRIWSRTDRRRRSDGRGRGSCRTRERSSPPPRWAGAVSDDAASPGRRRGVDAGPVPGDARHLGSRTRSPRR